MKNSIKWTSHSRRFTMPETPVVRPKGRGRGRMLGSPQPAVDLASRTVVVATSLFAFVILLAINGFAALVWLFVLGPVSLAAAGIIGSMGGVEWQRAVATVYVVGLMLLVVMAASLY